MKGPDPVDDAPARRPSFIRRTVSSLRWRNFRLFFVGQTISQTGNWLTNVALTLLILHRTGSGVALGLLVACQYGPILLLSAWAGVFVDRTNKRNLLCVTQALEMCESCALAALAFTHNAPLAAFYGIALAGGALLAVDNPVRRTLVNEMVPTRRDTQRRDPVQRHEQHGSHSGPRPRRPAHRDGRLRVVLHGGCRFLRGGPQCARPDAHGRTATAAADASRRPDRYGPDSGTSLACPTSGYRLSCSCSSAP